MNDVEIASLLEEAGYRFVASAGGYAAEGEDEIAYNSEDMADSLDIPLEDLKRWEDEQRAAEAEAPTE
jgi:hypothetical protein